MLTELVSNQRHANSQAPTYNVWGKGNRTSRTFSIHDRQDDSNTNTSQLLLTQPSKWRQQPESSAEGSLPKQSNVWEVNGFTQEACTAQIGEHTNSGLANSCIHIIKSKFRSGRQLIPGLQRLGQEDCLKFEVSLGYKVRPCPKQKKRSILNILTGPVEWKSWCLHCDYNPPNAVTHDMCI